MLYPSLQARATLKRRSARRRREALQHRLGLLEPAGVDVPLKDAHQRGVVYHLLRPAPQEAVP